MSRELTIKKGRKLSCFFQGFFEGTRVGRVEGRGGDRSPVADFVLDPTEGVGCKFFGVKGMAFGEDGNVMALVFLIWGDEA